MTQARFSIANYFQFDFQPLCTWILHFENICPVQVSGPRLGTLPTSSFSDAKLARCCYASFLCISVRILLFTQSHKYVCLKIIILTNESKQTYLFVCLRCTYFKFNMSCLMFGNTGGEKSQEVPIWAVHILGVNVTQ